MGERLFEGPMGLELGGIVGRAGDRSQSSGLAGYRGEVQGSVKEICQFELNAIKKSQISDFQGWDNGQGQKGQGHKGGLKLTPIGFDSLFDGAVPSGSVITVTKAHESCHREFQPRFVMSMHIADPPAAFMEQVDGPGEVMVIRAKGNDVVRIVGNGRGHGAMLQAKSTNKGDGRGGGMISVLDQDL